MKELSKLFNEVADKVVAEKAENIFSEAIEKSLKDIADSLFCSYGSDIKRS